MKKYVAAFFASALLIPATIEIQMFMVLGTDETTGVWLSLAIIEEVLKVLVAISVAFIFFAPKKNFVKLGAASALGFALMEMAVSAVFSFADGGYSLMWSDLFVRIFFGSVILHTITTALVMFGIARGWIFGIFATMSAIALHVAFNIFNTTQENLWAKIPAPLLGFIVISIILCAFGFFTTKFINFLRLRRKP